MKKTIFLSFFLFIISNAFAQKQIKDYTIEELTAKREAALTEKEISNLEIIDEAIKLKAEINDALKLEDYDKATVLQAKLLTLKLEPTKAEKIQEIQDNIKKAVASEDFEKADALKKELDALNNVPKATGPPSDVKYTGPPSDVKYTNTSSSSINNSSKSNASSSSLTKNDIYGNSVVWMGLDFSLFNYVSKKKVGEEDKHLKYIAAWQKEFAKGVPEKKLAQWLGKPQFMSESYYIEKLYFQNLKNPWITEYSSGLTPDKIQAQLRIYKSNNHGLALVFIPGTFNEIEGEMALNIVWFDLDSRTIVNLQEISVKAGPATMTGRWLNGLIDATKKYVDHYYKKRV